MSKIVLTPITNAQSLTNLNNNFDEIEDELNNKVLYRNNPVGEPNQMMNDLDMNSKNIINVGTIQTSDISIDGDSVTGILSQAQGAATVAVANAAIATTQAGIATTAAQTAVGQVGLALLKANNLSDVVSQSAALSNLLGTSAIPIANGGTGSTTAAAARTALGVPSTGANTFSGSQTFASANNLLSLNDTSGTGTAGIIYLSAGTNYWQIQKSAANNFNIQRYVSGSFVDNPISIATATGVVTFTQSPVHPTPSTADNSTNSATTGYVVAKLASPTPIGSATPSSAAFTTISSSSAATLNSLTVTNLLTPTGGIVGTVAGGNATTGNVGEVVESLGTSTAVTSNTAINLTSINLPAGDWDVTASIESLPAGTTVITNQVAGVGITSATIGGLGTNAKLNITKAAGVGDVLNTGTRRVNVTTTTTVYCVAIITFTTSTCNAQGYIRARRIR